MKLAGNPLLKDAILGMPPKERDKLLLTLIGKDPLLTEQLHFKLLEGPDELALRVEHAEEEVAMLAERLGNRPAQLLEAGRTAMKKLNHFARVTRHKYHEVGLKLQLLTTLPLPQHARHADVYSQRYATWFLQQAGVLRKKLAALDEDMAFDFADLANQLGTYERQMEKI